LNKTLLILLFFLGLTKGYSQIQFIILIDSACFVSNKTAELDGTFALFGDLKASEHRLWAVDTLIQKLEYEQEQTLSLQSQQYTLRFIPNDTAQQTHSVNFHPQIGLINLSCFFFNQSYPSTLYTLKNNEYIKIISQYAGPTNMSTMIPIYSLLIVKKRGDYYAIFTESTTNEQGFLLQLKIRERPVKGERIKIDERFIKLTSEQLQTLERCWDSMHTFWLDNEYIRNYIPSQTIIYDNNGTHHFQSNTYLSQWFWSNLNEQ